MNGKSRNSGPGHAAVRLPCDVDPDAITPRTPPFKHVFAAGNAQVLSFDPRPQASPVETGTRGSVFLGFAFGAVLMLLAAWVAARFAIRAERRGLEAITPPLSSRAPGD